MNTKRIGAMLVRVPPAVTAVVVAASIVVVVGLSRSCAPGAAVVVDEGGRLIRTTADGDASARGGRSFPDTPDLVLAERIAEAEGLAMGLVLVAAETAMQRKAMPAHVAALASGLSLLPPGVERDPARSGVFQSRTSELAVRYRPQPFAVEVVSGGRRGAARDGEMLVVVVRGEEPELYVAIETSATAPRPFAGEGELEASGFKRESMRRSTASDTEWLADVGAKEKAP